MSKALSVWLHDRHAGSLYLEGGRLRFAYSEQALADSTLPPLSCSMPKRSEPYDDQVARAFFGGLLPEGRLRNLIARQVQVSSQNEFGLLEVVGGECAGAVTITPEGVLPSTSTSSVRWLSEQELAAIIETLPRRPMLVGMDGLRLSLAGAQDKLPVVVEGERIGLPINGAISTHILKPAIAEIPETVVNEAFSLAVVRGMGIPTAAAQIRESAAGPVLLVERYDRQRAGGEIRRLHQEDFCQALGVVSENKYQAEGGPSFADCFNALRQHTRPSAPSINQLLSQAIVNALIGNHDAHAKNYSLLYTGSRPVLAPAYDVLSTAVYPTLTPKMAMKLGGKYKFSEVMDRHWDRFAEECGLGRAMARKRIRAIAEELPEVARQVAASEPAFAQSPVVNEILQLIDQRAVLTLQRTQDARQILLKGMAATGDARPTTRKGPAPR